MSTEYDPLLPRDQPAPEISGEGYSNSNINSKSKSKLQAQLPYEQDPSEDDNQDLSSSTSPLKTFFSLFAIIVTFALFVAILAPGGLGSPWKNARNESLSIKMRVDKIMSEYPLIDGHNDLAILIRFIYNNKIYDKNFTVPFEDGGFPAQVDLPRLKAGKAGGAFWSAFVPCPKNGTDFSDANYLESVDFTLAQLDVIRRLTALYPDVFTTSTADSSSVLKEFQQHSKLVSPMGIEGLHQIGNSYSKLRLYESLGVRYATLTHNCHNNFADAALVTNTSGVTVAAPPYWGGVSEDGQTIIREMNRIGMLVDLSHVSKNTMLDVLGGRPEKWKGSSAPVMFSHSSAYSLCPHPRNVPDDILKLVKRTNSIVMVNFSPDFVSCVPSDSSTGLPDLYLPNSTLHQVARHIVYIGNLIGFQHVGIGSDFDGIPATPEGLDDVSKFPDLVAELLEMGVTDDEAANIIGKNILRVWSDAEKTAIQMQNDGVLPAEDRMEDLHFP